jgi:hypothetical protein
MGRPYRTCAWTSLSWLSQGKSEAVGYRSLAFHLELKSSNASKHTEAISSSIQGGSLRVISEGRRKPVMKIKREIRMS